MSWEMQPKDNVLAAISYFNSFSASAADSNSGCVDTSLPTAWRIQFCGVSRPAGYIRIISSATTLPRSCCSSWNWMIWP